MGLSNAPTALLALCLISYSAFDYINCLGVSELAAGPQNTPQAGNELTEDRSTTGSSSDPSATGTGQRGKKKRKRLSIGFKIKKGSKSKGTKAAVKRGGGIRRRVTGSTPKLDENIVGTILVGNTDPRLAALQSGSLVTGCMITQIHPLSNVSPQDISPWGVGCDIEGDYTEIRGQSGAGNEHHNYDGRKGQQNEATEEYPRGPEGNGREGYTEQNTGYENVNNGGDTGPTNTDNGGDEDETPEKSNGKGNNGENSENGTDDGENGSDGDDGEKNRPPPLPPVPPPRPPENEDPKISENEENGTQKPPPPLPPVPPPKNETPPNPVSKENEESNTESHNQGDKQNNEGNDSPPVPPVPPPRPSKPDPEEAQQSDDNDNRKPTPPPYNIQTAAKWSESNETKPKDSFNRLGRRQKGRYKRNGTDFTVQS